MYMFLLPYIHLRPYPSLAEVFALGTSVLIAITLFHSSQLGRIVRAQRNSGNRLLWNVEPPWRSSIHFGSAIMAVTILHGVDVGIWAFLLYVTGSDSKRACQHLFRGQHLYHAGGLASRAGLARPESRCRHVGPDDVRMDNRGYV